MSRQSNPMLNVVSELSHYQRTQSSVSSDESTRIVQRDLISYASFTTDGHSFASSQRTPRTSHCGVLTSPRRARSAAPLNHRQALPITDAHNADSTTLTEASQQLHRRRARCVVLHRAPAEL